MILLRSRCPSYIAQQAKDRAACLQQRPAGRMLVRTDKHSVDVVHKLLGTMCGALLIIESIRHEWILQHQVGAE